VSTSVAITAVSIAAAAQSSRAQDEACTALLATFNSAGSTPAQRQLYAECVQRVEPVRTPEDEANLKLGAGVLIGSAVLGAVLGAALNRYDRDIGAFLGFFAAPVTVGMLWLVWALAAWLFT